MQEGGIPAKGVKIKIGASATRSADTLLAPSNPAPLTAATYSFSKISDLCNPRAGKRKVGVETGSVAAVPKKNRPSPLDTSQKSGVTFAYFWNSDYQ